MLKQSVISQSGQGWKLVIAILALLVGSFAPLFPDMGISWTLGTVVAIVGYIFGMIAIRCMHCGNLWFWEAAKDAGLYSPLFKKSSCPNCGHDFS